MTSLKVDDTMATNHSWLLLIIAHLMIIGLLDLDDYLMIIGQYSRIISTSSYGDYTYKCYDNIGSHCLISPKKDCSQTIHVTGGHCPDKSL